MTYARSIAEGLLSLNLQRTSGLLSCVENTDYSVVSCALYRVIEGERGYERNSIFAKFVRC